MYSVMGCQVEMHFESSYPVYNLALDMLALSQVSCFHLDHSWLS